MITVTSNRRSRCWQWGWRGDRGGSGRIKRDRGG